jgi:tRNA threonylcarbamoyladenosine biosynthesis protein TsaE
MAQNYSYQLANTEATEAFGAVLARCCQPGTIVYLHGDLGAGKTTLVRGFLQALGHTGAVKSPTYTLVEPYELAACRAYHFDLYRLGDPEELEYLGIRDYFDGDALALIEWPQRGIGLLPAPSIEVSLAYRGEGRVVTIVAASSSAEAICGCVDTHFHQG